MSEPTYRLLHFAGLLLLYGAIGCIAMHKGEGKPPKLGTILHGVGLVVMLVAGFGMLARMEIHWPWPSYVMVKVGLWVALGALPILMRKKILPGVLGLLVAAGIGTFAFWLVQTRPAWW